MMGPLMPGLMAHVNSAMTHLVLDIQTSTCSFLDLLVHHYPAFILPSSSQVIHVGRKICISTLRIQLWSLKCLKTCKL
ncbi:hypothetical protein CY35_18G049800 [Sphagnum magellanicum]|nr:hypothetical protein CY35_18G049800 [Sphagnum magellanicum]